MRVILTASAIAILLTSVASVAQAPGSNVGRFQTTVIPAADLKTGAWPPIIVISDTSNGTMDVCILGNDSKPQCHR